MMNRVIEKEDLVRIAGDIFRQKGYAGTSIDDIAKRCGLTKGSLYHHFSGKDAIAQAAIAQVHATYREHIFSLILDREKPAVGDLEAFNRAVEAFFSTHPHGCLPANLSLEMGGAYDLFRDEIRSYFDEWTACYERVFSRYMTAAEARMRAEDAIAAVQGCVLMYRMHGNLAPLQRQHAALVALCKEAAKEK
jgi:AcrR family transcriptional regulator